MRAGGLAGVALALLALSGCAALAPKPKPAPPIKINLNPYPSTYERYPGVPTVIRNATVFDGEGQQINNGTVIFANGAIQAVGGPDLAIYRGDSAPVLALAVGCLPR